MPSPLRRFASVCNTFPVLQNFQKLSGTQKTGLALIMTFLVSSILCYRFAPAFRSLIGRCFKQPPPPIVPVTESTAESIPLPPTSHTAPEAWFSGIDDCAALNVSDCTPLALLFAATASDMANANRLGTPQEITTLLTTFDQQATALQWKRQHYSNTKNSISLVNQMMTKGVFSITGQITINWQYAWIRTREDREIEGPNTSWQLLLTEGLTPGQGAVIESCQYSFAVRRLQNCWEFFNPLDVNKRDTRAFQGLSLPKGPSIKRCPSAAGAILFCYDTLRAVNPAPLAQGVTISIVSLI